MIDVRMFTVGTIQENCFVLRRQRAASALMVDPGDEAEKLLGALEALVGSGEAGEPTLEGRRRPHVVRIEERQEGAR